LTKIREGILMAIWHYNLLLVEHLEVSEIGERFNKRICNHRNAMQIDIQQFHLAMHPNQDSN
jgi:hypothetical protein